MPSCSIIFDVDEGPKLDAKPEDVIETSTESLTFIRIPCGMVSGKDSVMIRVDLPDGRHVLAQLSMEIFVNIAQAFKTRMEFEGITLDMLQRVRTGVLGAATWNAARKALMACNRDVQAAIQLLREQAKKLS